MADQELVRKTKIEIFRAVLALDDKAPIFIELAESLLEDGKPGEAVNICERGLVHHPGLLAGRILLAEALEAAGREDEAREALASASSQAAQTTAILDRMSRLEERLKGEEKEAPQEPEFPVLTPEAGPEEESEPPVEMPSPTLAYLYLRQGEPRAAARVYKQLLAKDPDNEKIKAKLEALAGQLGGKEPRRTLAALEKWLGLVQARIAGVAS